MTQMYSEPDSQMEYSRVCNKSRWWERHIR